MSATGYLGSQIVQRYFFPDLSTQLTPLNYTVVDPGVEVPAWLGGDATIDLDDDGITISFAGSNFFKSGTFNGPVWADEANNVPTITAVSLSETIADGDLTSGDVSWDDDNVRLNLADVSYLPGETITLNVTFAPAVTKTGTNGPDTINGDQGGTADDTVNAGSGNDVVNGLNGADNLNGGSGNDTLSGGSGTDRLDGGTGADTLNGNGDNDVLIGGDGNDVMNGGNGADRLNGGGGNDTMDGGNGPDRFIFAPGGGGADQINGFNIGTDFLELQGLTVKKVADVFAAGNAGTADMLVTLSSGSVLLVDVGAGHTATEVGSPGTELEFAL